MVMEMPDLIISFLSCSMAGPRLACGLAFVRGEHRVF
jgi:hypothetical protein